MNKAEAQDILAQELNRLQAQRFKDLQELINSPRVIELTGASGVSYQIEIQAFWDNPREILDDLRIVASVDDGRVLSALFPLSEDFIIGADGKLK